MILVIAILAGITTYFVLFEMLFEDRNEFAEKLKDFAIWTPVRALLDYSSEKESLRIWFWLPSGFVVGAFVYALLR